MEVDPSMRPLPDYVQNVQREVSADMRCVLVEVAEEYEHVSVTLYLCVAYADRFLSLNAVSTKGLQLLGVAAMLIASKYEEIKAPAVGKFCYIMDYTYSKEYELGVPTVKTFLRRFSRVGKRAMVCEFDIQSGGNCYFFSQLGATSTH
ncbi:hypothetical protein AAZX31_17G225000 [Glycine max]